MAESIASLIGQSEFFKGISQDACARLAKVCHRRRLRKRDTLFLEGSTGGTVFILEDGCLQLTKTAASGDEVVIKTVRPGELFGEVVLFEQDDYPVTATAVISSSVLGMSRIDIQALLGQAGFRREFIASLMRRQRYLAGRVRYLASYDVEERFLLFLRDHYGRVNEIEPDISKRDMAAAIGATPETFSRLIRRLSGDGTITWQGGSLALDPRAWERLPE
jgi:CRP/FNR family transcriptional regulator